MRARGLFIIFIILLIMSGPLYFFDACLAGEKKNPDPSYIFYKGNTLYEEGKYDLAAAEYSKILDNGVESGNVYYNIGNCYLKMGEPGMAVLNYERANRLIPWDSDLRSNYEFAKSKIKYRNVDMSQPWYRMAFSVFDRVSINETTVLLSSVFVILISIMIARLYVYVIRRYSIYLIAVLIIVFLIAGVSLYKKIDVLGREAVVITEVSEAKFEPLESATTYFTLYEGMKVEIIEPKREWVRVRRQDGKTGWIRSRAIKKI